MKKVINRIIELSLVFAALLCFSGCPEYPEGPVLSDFECSSAEEMVNYMNSKNLGSSFKLVSSDYKESDCYKIRTVKMEADNIPNKIVTMYDFVGSDPSQLKEIISGNSRNIRCSGVVYCSQWLLSDYNYVRFENEYKTYFEGKYAPLYTKADNSEYEHKLFIRPLVWFMDVDDCCSSFEQIRKSYSSYYLQNSIFIKREWTSDFSREFNAFCYDKLNNDEILMKKTMSYFYFGKDLDCSSITEEKLYAGQYSGKNNIKEVTFGQQYWVD